ncbi:VanZ family protein [Methylibium petroleiphilum]|uniref:VanZ family protein n=1 Tax=Methylibium petroleiphilum TaxID=105560 RepID=UPI003D2830CA
MAPQRSSSAWPLAAACACLMVYASLHPFTGWEWPTATDIRWWLLPVPKPRGVGQFDLVSNLLAYVPLGALVAGGLLRGGTRAWLAFAVAVGVSSGLSYVLETLQHLLPRRVPSIIDWSLNTAGAALGAVLMLVLHALGLLGHWQRWRERWLLRDRGAGLTLLLLWPFGLLFPPPLPFGLGHVLDRARDLLAEGLEDTAWDGWLGATTTVSEPLAPGLEMLGVAAGLLAPCLLAYALTRPGPRRLVLPAGALLLGIAATTLSTALNFGPEHALTWWTPPVLPAIGVVAVVAVGLTWLPARASAAVALLVISFGVALVNIAPGDAYYAASLQSWEQGRFIRFHGLSQWIGWLWPWATLAYLLGRVAARDE